MKSPLFVHLNIILITLILTKVCFAQNVTSYDTYQCLENNLSSIDESSEDGDVFDEFLNKITTYTGLKATENFNVSVNCQENVCIVNPNGTAIWDARMYLYLTNMMSNATDTSTTIDGCQCHSADLTSYADCMTRVRQNMIAQLDTVFVEKFKSIVESDNCNLFKANCVTSLAK